MPTIKGFKVGDITYSYMDENIAPEFSTTSTYTVGKYVINPDDGFLYRCHTAVTTKGNWTGTTNWTKVKIAGDTDTTLSIPGMAADAEALKNLLDDTCIKIKGSLTSSDDLNNINGIGLYRWTSDNTPINAPTSQGILIVAKPNSSTTISTAQIVISNTNKVFTRFRTSAGYGAFKELARSEAVDEINTFVSNLEINVNELETATSELQIALEDKLGKARSLTSEDDLNNISQLGIYSWSSDVQPGNAPISQGILIVGRSNSNVNGFQIVISNTNRVFTRYRTSAGYGVFREIYNETTIVNILNNVKSEMMAAIEQNKFLDRRAQIYGATKGELELLPTTGMTPFVSYGISGNEIVERSDVLYGTDYIKCPKNLLICFNDGTSRLYIYFYDLVEGEYVPRWDLLKIVTSTNILNYFGLNTSRNRTITIPDGVYMKVCKAVDGDVELFGWTGTHLGVDMSGDSYGIEKDSTTRKTYTGNATTVTIPGNAKMLFCKNAALIDLFGFGQTELLTTSDARRYNQCFKLPDGYNYFIALIALDYLVDPEQTGSFTNTKIQALGNLNDYISTLAPYDITLGATGRAAEVLRWAKYICDIRWTSLTTKWIVGGSAANDGKFKEGYQYTGIPYTSRWTNVNWFGWHVSRHTWMNAANDKRSYFYVKSDRRGGSMGYGLVCSTFACLCAGWPYPQTTYTFTRDPDVIPFYSNNILPGEISAVSGHTLIPETTGKGTDYEMYTIYEGAAPATKRRACWSFREVSASSGYSYRYVNQYFKYYTRLDAVGHPNAYNITDYTIINGTARPFIGDRGCYTSNDQILINIYSDTATTLLYQKCTYNDGVFTPNGTIQSKTIDGVNQLEIDKETLQEGFYAVYTDADDIKEYFEYHIVSPITWSKTENNLVFSNNDFWYAVWWQVHFPDEEQGEERTDTEVIPGCPDGDYSKYYQVYAFNPVATVAAFYKGTLGAYAVPMQYQA